MLMSSLQKRSARAELAGDFKGSGTNFSRACVRSSRCSQRQWPKLSLSFTCCERSMRMCWDDVKSDVLRSKPTSAPYAPSMFSFILKWIGGLHCQLMRDTEKYVNGVGRVHRSLGGDIFSALIQDVKGPDQHATTRHTHRKGWYCHDAAIKVSDIKKVLAGGMAKKRNEAESVLQRAKQIASKESIDTSNILGDLTYQLALCLMGKKGAMETCGECAHEFVLRFVS